MIKGLMNAKICKNFSPDCPMIVVKGDSSSWQGFFESTPFSMVCGELGNTLLSFDLDARSDNVKKEEQEAK